MSGKDQADHLCHLQEVFHRLRLVGIHLNKAKCAFLADSVVYCGYRVDATGIRPVQESIRAIVEAPAPQNTSQLKSVLGMLNYYVIGFCRELLQFLNRFTSCYVKPWYGSGVWSRVRLSGRKSACLHPWMF